MITHHSHFPHSSVVRIALAAAGLLAACQPLDTPAPPPAAPAAEVPATATTAPTRTPLPTATQTTVPTATAAPTNTPLPTATKGPDLAATQAARATATTEALIAGINSQLGEFNLSTDQGRYGGQGNLIKLTVSSYMEADFAEPYPDLQVSDFVLHTKLTWHTSSGLAGCGILFRADPLEPWSQRPTLYELMLVRLQNAPGWWLIRYEEGKFKRELVDKSSAYINDEQDSVNDLILVVRGDTYTLYANGKKIGQGVDSALARGALAFQAYQESGKTVCTFSETWLWILDDVK